jgi:hypothetical protein
MIPHRKFALLLLVLAFLLMGVAPVQAQGYQGASQWAVPELDKALEYGLITDRIRQQMNAPITREEFAEIAVKLYEKGTGNPAACAVGYELIASRAIRQMQGLTSKSSRITAVCRNAFTFSPQAVPRFLRANTYWSEDGWVAEILPGQKSSMIHSLIDYNALIEIPEGQSELSAGSPVTLILTGQ